MKKMPVEFIHSFAVRNFRTLTGLHTFRFEKGINTITGGNASTKSSFIDAIEFVFNPSNEHKWWPAWEFGSEPRPTLLEITFTAGSKFHYLRRVANGRQTTDLHLYIGEKNQEFYRDGEAAHYLEQIIPPNLSKTTNISNTRFTWINATQRYADADKRTISDNLQKIDAKINTLLNDTKCDMNEIFSINGISYVKFSDGSEVDFERLSTKEKVFIDRIYNILKTVELQDPKNDSSVLIFDDFERTIGRKFRTIFANLLNQITVDNQFQIILISRYRLENTNLLRVSYNRIPSVYKSINSTSGVMSNRYHNIFKKINSFTFRCEGGKIDWKK